jgi:hypothetical protein
MKDFLVENMARHIGQTVTIFTTSGGLSGNGFTGVLAGICGGCVKLITDIGGAPACPIGSACCGGIEGGFGMGMGFGGGMGMCGRGGCGCGGRGGYALGGWLGSVTQIPLDKIAGFTHNAI